MMLFLCPFLAWCCRLCPSLKEAPAAMSSPEDIVDSWEARRTFAKNAAAVSATQLRCYATAPVRMRSVRHKERVWLLLCDGHYHNVKLLAKMATMSMSPEKGTLVEGVGDEVLMLATLLIAAVGGCALTYGVSATRAIHIHPDLEDVVANTRRDMGVADPDQLS